MQKLFGNIIIATLGLWLATMLVPGVMVTLDTSSNFFGFPLTQLWQLFLLLGVSLGLINYYIKPALDALSLPLKIVTLGLFSLVINLGLIWVVDSIFKEFTAPLYYPLFWTAIIIWTLSVIVNNVLAKKE